MTPVPSDRIEKRLRVAGHGANTVSLPGDGKQGRAVLAALPGTDAESEIASLATCTGPDDLLRYGPCATATTWSSGSTATLLSRTSTRPDRASAASAIAAH